MDPFSVFNTVNFKNEFSIDPAAEPEEENTDIIKERKKKVTKALYDKQLFE